MQVGARFTLNSEEKINKGHTDNVVYKPEDKPDSCYFERFITTFVSRTYFTGIVR